MPNYSPYWLDGYITYYQYPETSNSITTLTLGQNLCHLAPPPVEKLKEQFSSTSWRGNQEINSCGERADNTCCSPALHGHKLLLQLVFAEKMKVSQQYALMGEEGQWCTSESVDCRSKEVPVLSVQDFWDDIQPSLSSPVNKKTLSHWRRSCGGILRWLENSSTWIRDRCLFSLEKKSLCSYLPDILAIKWVVIEKNKPDPSHRDTE